MRLDDLKLHWPSTRRARRHLAIVVSLIAGAGTAACDVAVLGSGTPDGGGVTANHDAGTGGSSGSLGTGGSSGSLSTGGSGGVIGTGGSSGSLSTGGSGGVIGTGGSGGDAGALFVVGTANCAPIALAVDSTDVYFTCRATPNALMQLPLAGGTPKTLATAFSMYDVAVDSKRVYWIEQGQYYNEGRVMALAKSGGTPQVLADAQDLPSALAIDAHAVYWIDDGPPSATYPPTHGSVMKAPLDGGPIETLASNQVVPNGIALDSSFVYWNVLDAVLKTPLSPGNASPTKISTTGGSNSLGFDSLAVDSSYAYFTASTGDVDRVPIGGGASTKLGTIPTFANEIATDATSVYSLGSAEGWSLARTTKASGASTQLASEVGPDASGLAVDSLFVYVGVDAVNGRGDGRIVRVPK